MQLKREEVTLMPLEIKNMSQKALKYNAHNLQKEDNKTIDTCVEMIKFGGAAKDKTMEDENIVLVTGAYESEFCADIVASYVFEITEISFLQARHRGIY
eukprot:8245500-Ditylum_brightwellii.AAC.1